jgi:hypothetical protein
MSIFSADYTDYTDFLGLGAKLFSHQNLCNLGNLRINTT